MSAALPSRFADALADRYRLIRELGAGGMATVYLAQDIRHDRQVALKVLKPELSAVIGAERFLVEIKTTANLQHPHILPLFDSGEVDGVVFYVMPFVEGETLRDRLTRERQLPIDDAVRITSEVASALDYAHRHGVVHRDIKPENILLHDGRALVADFGIALAARSGPGGARLTETGMSLGTPHYMSPEQALGERTVDARTDVYALGCVLHEMLVGEPPFTGATAQAVLARVLGNEPEPVTAIRRTVPEHIANAVLTALAKLPADRYASAAAFAAALSGATGTTGATRSTSALRQAATAPRGKLQRAAWPVAFVAAASIAAWGWMRPAPERIPTRLALSVPDLGGSSTFLQRMLDISPDGRSLIYVKGVDGEERLMLHHLDEEFARPLTQVPPSFSGPSFSPDGRSFVASNISTNLTMRFTVEGGRAEALPRNVPTAFYSAWSPDGSVWLSGVSATSRGVARLAPTGEVTTPLPASMSSMGVQQILAGGRYALAVQAPLGTSFGQAYVLDLEKETSSPILGTDIVELRYTDGFLVYVLGSGVLEAVRFDLSTRTTQGAPVRIASDVSLTGGGTANFAVSSNGTLAYVPEAPRSLVLFDREGRARPASGEGRNFHMPRFSPDGRYLLTDFGSVDGRDVWRLELATSMLTRVTFDRDGHDASWEPDGKGIAYISATRVPGMLTIQRSAPGRSSAPDSLFSNKQLGYTGTWLRDRSAIVTSATNLRGDSRGDIAIVRNAGRGPLEAVVATPFDESFPAVSPDGRWVAYTSDQTGRIEVYVRPLDRDGEELRVSLAGGTEPAWAPSGRELFYRAARGNQEVLMAATLAIGNEVTVTARQDLFDVSETTGSSPHANYDVSPDGRTFAMVLRNPSRRIVIIQQLDKYIERQESRDRP